MKTQKKTQNSAGCVRRHVVVRPKDRLTTWRWYTTNCCTLRRCLTCRRWWSANWPACLCSRRIGTPEKSVSSSLVRSQTEEVATVDQFLLLMLAIERRGDEKGMTDCLAITSWGLHWAQCSTDNHAGMCVTAQVRDVCGEQSLSSLL